MRELGTSNTQQRIVKRIKNGLVGEVTKSSADKVSELLTAELVKLLGIDRVDEIGDEALATLALRELQGQLSLPVSEWPEEPGGIYIARKIAARFGARWCEQCTGSSPAIYSATYPVLKKEGSVEVVWQETEATKTDGLPVDTIRVDACYACFRRSAWRDDFASKAVFLAAGLLLVWAVTIAGYKISDNMTASETVLIGMAATIVFGIMFGVQVIGPLLRATPSGKYIRRVLYPIAVKRAAKSATFSRET